MYPKNGVRPNFSFPVTDNSTPYSQCLAELAQAPGENLPVFAVGEVADKTGQISDENGYALTQGVSEMLISALFKSGKTFQAERFDRLLRPNVTLRDRGTLVILRVSVRCSEVFSRRQKRDFRPRRRVRRGCRRRDH